MVGRPSPDTARQLTARPRFDSGTSPQALFVFRLRLHRERSRITLDQIAAATRVRRELLEGLERNDLANWPRGLYARAWMRAYACLVGLDPVDTVDEFCRLFPHGDRRAGPPLRQIAAIVSTASEYQDEIRAVERRRVPSRARVSQPAQSDSTLTRAAHAIWMWIVEPRPSY